MERTCIRQYGQIYCQAIFKNVCWFFVFVLNLEYSHSCRRDQLCAESGSVMLDFLSLGWRSMTPWICADMLTVLLHQLFDNKEVIATPASCFQRGVLCV